MKQILRQRVKVVFLVLVATGICFAVTLPSDAKADHKPSIQTVCTSPDMVQDSSEIVFDGYGTLGVILNLSAPQSARDTGGTAAPVSVIIDGDQYELSKEVVICRDLLQEATINDLNPNSYVGFKKDPSGKISELWMLKSEKKKMKERDLQKTAPSVAVPPADSQKIKNEGGIWKN